MRISLRVLTFAVMASSLTFVFRAGAVAQDAAANRFRPLNDESSLISPTMRDLHQSQFVLWTVHPGVDEDKAAALREHATALRQKALAALKAGKEKEAAELKEKLNELHRLAFEQHQRFAAEGHESQAADDMKPPHEVVQQHEQIRALHEAAERLQNAGLIEIAAELRERAQMTEKQLGAQLERMKRSQQEHHRHEANSAAEHHRAIEREKSGQTVSPETERRLDQLTAQVRELQRSVTELNEKLNRIVELRKQEADSF